MSMLPRPSNSVAHRLRCITIRAGIVNTCPACGFKTITDWTWDMTKDPARPANADIDISSPEALEALADIGTTTMLPCEGC